MNDTTPRDDIAGLIERLRYISLVMFSAHEKNVPMSVWEKDHAMIAEAATQLAALSARVKELERIERNRDMWKGQCERQAEQLTSLREDNDMMHDLVDQRTTTHHDVESRCDELTQKLATAEARATRLQQERDEAYERAAKAIDAAAKRQRIMEDGAHAFSYSGNGPSYTTSKALERAAVIVRQLSAGPEKEKKDA